MYDIIKSINNPHLGDLDPQGNMYALDHWSPRTANRIAAEDGVVLEEDHWQVIYCLRELFRISSGDWSARRLTRRMERNFAAEGGRRYLYSLFPRGPVVQACRLAGLPLPEGTLDKSFGSVH